MGQLTSWFSRVIFAVILVPIVLTARFIPEQSARGGLPELKRCRDYIDNSLTPGDTIRSIPTPTNHIMGIEWVRDTLYILSQAPDSTQYATLYKLDPADGTLLSQFTLPFTGWILGLCFDGDNLWVVKWAAAQVICRITTAGILVSSFPAPSSNPRGIAWDGEYLWIGDAQSKVLYQVDTLGNVIRTVSMSGTISWNMGMEWVPEHINGHLWVNDDNNNDINQLDVSDSIAILIQDFSHPATYPEGICHDGQHLWVADYYALKLWQIDDGIAEAVEETSFYQPKTMQLLQSYPNPFKSSTSIRYVLPNNIWTGFDIYDIEGQLVRSLEKGIESAGVHTINWNGRDNSGEEVPSGIYFVRFQAGDYGGIKKLLLVR